MSTRLMEILRTPMLIYWKKKLREENDKYLNTDLHFLFFFTFKQNIPLNLKVVYFLRPISQGIMEYLLLCLPSSSPAVIYNGVVQNWPAAVKYESSIYFFHCLFRVQEECEMKLKFRNAKEMWILHLWYILRMLS